MDPNRTLGIDIGGSGIKVALVDVRTGHLVTGRQRVKTPKPAAPDAIIKTVCGLCEVVDPSAFGAVGVGFPAAVKDGKVLTATNIDDEWIQSRPGDLLSEALGRRVAVLNDADAAGLAEMRFGAGRGVRGTVVVLTLGTGIGTGLFRDGVLIPNAELGRVKIAGKQAQQRASEAARKRRGVGWEEWASDLGRYLEELEQLIWPDLVIIGGGASAKSHFFLHRIDSRMPIVPAKLRNNAGIVGAAIYASEARERDECQPQDGGP
jgi:polyphosphate glucokinase